MKPASRFTEENLSKCSKEELIDIINKLQEDASGQTAQQSGLAKSMDGCGFKEKYALQILDSLPDMLTVLTDDGILVDLISSDETNHVGAPIEQIRGVDIKTFLPEQAYASVKENLDLVVATQNASTSHHTLYEDGAACYYENCIIPLEMGYNLCICRGVTESVKAKNKIQELNSLMDAILNNIPVYLFVKDTGDDFRYLYWNKAFEEHSGIPASRAVGRTDRDIFPNRADAEQFRSDDMELLRNGERMEFMEDYASVDGTKRIVRTSKVLAPREHSMPLLIGVSWDITDMKNTEQQLIAAKTEAEQSNRLKTAFLANMSHEIRTPLNAIVGFSKLVSSTEDMEEKRQFSDIIDSNADLLLQLINDILDLSKIEAGTLEFVKGDMNLTELCLTMQEVHKLKAKEGVSILFEGEYSDLIINSDRNRLAQVFTNLINNAVKFTDAGEIRFGYTVKPDHIEVFVSDTGVGIAADKVGTIFDRFVKLNKFVQGTGLGLSITKMIIEKIGGTISVSSVEGKGTKFVFTIPHINKKTKPPVPKEVAEQENNLVDASLNNDKKIVLIVEDDHSNYLLLKTYIGSRYVHFHASNGKEAVELFERYKPHIVLMDMKMPVMDGLEATKIIRQKSKTVPIVALTAFAYESDKRAAMDAGCNKFLTKPVSFTQLNDVFAEYID